MLLSPPQSAPSTATPTRTSLKIQCAIGVAVAAALLYLHGNRFVFTQDEGIVLDAAKRMLEGQRPYLDFFGYMSPGSYWLQALVFQIFGIHLWAGRLIVIADVSLQCALVFRLVDRLGARKSAIMATILFLSAQLADPTFLTAQHRWDSATLALLAVSLALDSRWIASGALAAFAALCTPSTALVFAVTLGWLWISRDRNWVRFVIGAAAVAGIALAWLASNGELVPLVEQLRWLQKNYAEVNVMPYGSIIGGYAAIVNTGEGFGKLIPLGLAACLALPAILPILGGIGLGIHAFRGGSAQKSIFIYLIAAMASLVATAFPRADVAHLAFVAALPFSITAIWIARTWRERSAAYAVMGFAIFPAAFLMNFTRESLKSRPLMFHVEHFRVPAEEHVPMSELIAKVNPGNSLYIHPYMPILYFATQTSNPTRFAYLAPGMMTAREEAQAIEELAERPPQWVLHQVWTRAEFLRLFPHATGLSPTFPRIEAWIAENYAPLEPPLLVSGYQLLRRTTP